MVNILADENIINAKEVFSSLGNVTLIPGREIKGKDVKNKDALIVRSITKIDRNLLEDSNVKFVGSATIGVDHLDINYLKNKNIYYCNAPGSNSYSVVEYVISALINLAVKYNFNLRDKTIGIIGVGNIGSKVENFAKAFGMKVLLNDPPLKELTNDKKYLPLDDLLNSDILTLHVPYTTNGKYQTHHLIDENVLKKLNENTILINTSRGSVVDNSALNKAINYKKIKAVLDVWENEPNIDLNLLGHVELGTSHIAGYSLDGKINGTKIIYKHLAKFLRQKDTYKFEDIHVDLNDFCFELNDNIEKSLLTIFNNIYDVNDDYKSLLKILYRKENIFDGLRKNYKIRREYSNYSVSINSKYKKEIEILEKLRFKVKTI